MNRTSIEHLCIAVTIQVVVALMTGDWLVGGVFAAGLFFGREHAQREYKIGDPSLLVGYEALDFWRWSRDSILDLLAPVLGVSSVAILVWLTDR